MNAKEAASIADDAIGLFLEYRDQFGYDEDRARASAVLEVTEAERLTEEDIRPKRWGTHYDTIPHGPGSCYDPEHCDCECEGCPGIRDERARVAADAAPRERDGGEGE